MIDALDVLEFHYITPIDNLASIMRRGILSHNRAQAYRPKSIAAKEVQDLRKGRVVRDGRTIHDYANVYFNARNPMMYKRKHLHATLAVLRIEAETLDLPGAVVTDGNGATGYTRFYEPYAGLLQLDGDQMFAEYWTCDDPVERSRRKWQRCAELLIPDQIPSSLVFGAYVSCDTALSQVVDTLPAVDARISEQMFFRQAGVVDMSRSLRRGGRS